uniref:Uncharacterized protein n=1 Tax=Arundo donax TaxID=35708 RepID=A0A0A8ZWH4_ARUDO
MTYDEIKKNKPEEYECVNSLASYYCKAKISPSLRILVNYMCILLVACKSCIPFCC